MLASPFFNTVWHRAIITPVGPLRARLIGASPQISGSSSGHQKFWLRLQTNLVPKIE